MEHGWRFEDWGDAGVAAEAMPAAADVDASLALAPRLHPVAQRLGSETWHHFSSLATLGAVDLTTARVLEPHVDALASLAQAGDPAPAAIGAGSEVVWGVLAADGPGHGLSVRPAGSDGGFVLVGSKPWCSLGERLTHALVVADDTSNHTPSNETLGDTTPGDTTPQSPLRRLFAVELAPDRVKPLDSVWAPLGLAGIRTVPLRFDEARALPVGGPGWYFERPGFAWGGIGVAAVWFGGAAAVAGLLLDAAKRREPDQIALAAIGRVDRCLHCALLTLTEAARDIDAGRATGRAGVRLAARVRAVVAATVDEVVQTVGHALGPATLSQNAEHARRVANLTLYVRQHHADRDLAVLGRYILEADA